MKQGKSGKENLGITYQTLGLEVVPDLERLGEVPVLYSNFALVRANQEETSIVLCVRMDPSGKVVDEVFMVSATPQALLVMSTGHARRLAQAILDQMPPEFDDE